MDNIQKITAPEGFETQGTDELVHAEPVKIPGETHPHYAIVVRHQIVEEEREQGYSSLKAADNAVEVFFGDDEQQRDRELAENQRLREILDGDEAFTLVGFCKPGGVEVFDAYATLDEAKASIAERQERLAAKAQANQFPQSTINA